ncbi:hypothetical protein TNCV_4411591 [Trichonephila clavipes]|nr:hypothetical protein TNCV_4411591 [Trichonephila clavipes]
MDHAVASRQCIRSHGSIHQAVSDQQNITVMEHPPYSPDFGPRRDFFIFLAPVLGTGKGNPFYPQLEGVQGRGGRSSLLSKSSKSEPTSFACQPSFLQNSPLGKGLPFRAMAFAAE